MKKKWVSVATELADKLIDKVVHFCENIYVVVDECYARHAEEDPFTLAELYLDEKDVELLKRMPDEVYEAFFADRVRDGLERLAEEATEAAEEEEGEL